MLTMNDTTLTRFRWTGLHWADPGLESRTQNVAKSRQFQPEMCQNDANFSKEVPKRHTFGILGQLAQIQNGTEWR